MSSKLQPYLPPWWLKNEWVMTLYAAWGAPRRWQTTLAAPQPPYRDTIFTGAEGVPIFGWIAIPPQPRGTIVGTYGITGNLENQWFLQLLGRKAFARGYAVVLFDWRAHGQTARLSPTLTSDGLYEGEDFVRIAAGAKALGCPAPFWLTGFSLGGQLALWGIKAGQDRDLCGDIGLGEDEIAGGAAICPSLDSDRSLDYLVQHPMGRYIEKAIARQLQKLARQMQVWHPHAISTQAIQRANSIRGFDRELVIDRLGFSSTKAYYDASSPLYFLPSLRKRTLILYALKDPLFHPAIASDLNPLCTSNQAIDLVLTRYGGHVGYISRRNSGDPDCWWGWNRVLDWCDEASGSGRESDRRL